MKFLARDQLPTLLADLSTAAEVWVPVKQQNGVVQFDRWAPDVDVELDVFLARQSPKENVFPQTETYLEYRYLMVCSAQRPEFTDQTREELRQLVESEGGEVVAEVPPVAQELLLVADVGGGSQGEPGLGSAAGMDDSAQIILGLRPCDARGLSQMDNVFGGYGGFYFDPYYNVRRNNTTIIAVTCRTPRSTCFCRALGGSPAGTEGVDVLMTEIEGGFAVEAVTPKGESLVERSVFEKAQPEVEESAVAAKQAAEAGVNVPFELDGVREGLKAGFDSPVWHDLAMRCISCGTCTYVCPSCYCFNINDEIVEGTGERFRCWDNCFNPMYTLETSGHNPRESKHARFRNRFSHKFWYYPDKYDSLLCSGCGRCIMYCPTHVDIREVLRTMSAETTAEKGEA
ncbi:MAG: 4Fe-4S binding protein [Actinobacteria bacterium]|nr:4Fe-4S binding protein [Actinomycetota bacterium]